MYESEKSQGMTPEVNQSNLYVSNVDERRIKEWRETVERWIQVDKILTEWWLYVPDEFNIERIVKTIKIRWMNDNNLLNLKRGMV